MGVPGFASFWAELLVFIAAVRTYPVLGVLSVGALLVSALFMLRVFRRAFFGPRNPEWDHLQEITPWLGVPRAVLVGVLVLFGFFPFWVLDLIGSTTRDFVGRF
jgi:NADH-quinone oxidoreductase subunit M